MQPVVNAVLFFLSLVILVMLTFLFTSLNYTQKPITTFTLPAHNSPLNFSQ